MRFAVVLLLVAAVEVVHADAQTAVERGKYLTEVLGTCGNCHTPKGPGAVDLPGKHLAGGRRFEAPYGLTFGRNLTPDKETGLGNWTDGDIVRAIREGKGKDGKTLGPPMSFYLYRNISDNDIAAIVAYLRTVPPVRNEVPASQYKIPPPPAYGPPVSAVPDPPKNDPIKYGEYLSGPISHCAHCHTPPGPGGRPDMTKFFAGGFPFTEADGTVYSSNLTPDGDSGIGKWTDEQLARAIYGVRPDGRALRFPMPWPYYAGKIQDEDMRAIIAYLRSLKPIANKVLPFEPKK